MTTHSHLSADTRPGFTETPPVVIAGAGPTGMMLAGELALAGVRAIVVEPRIIRDLESSRAGGLYARTLEVLDQRGIVERFVAEGQKMQLQGFAYIPLDISDFPTRHNHGLALRQPHVERILAAWIDELGVTVMHGREVVGFDQDDEGVDVALSDGTTLRAAYLVGCDGARSAVRKAAHIEFAGFDPSISFLIAEVRLTRAPETGIRPEGGGIGPVDFQRGGNPYRVVLKEQRLDGTAEPTLEDLRGALLAAYGDDYGAHEPTWVSRFTDASRQATHYRAGRVLLAGDAAHIHSPHGGQGLNTGVQDAVNLGWKLAQVVKGASPETLLDTYHTERHPVAARVLQNTMAQVAISTPGDRHDALRATLAELLALDEPRRHLAAMLTGLDIRYDLGDGHPLLGRRMPDLDLDTVGASTRVYAHLHDARPVLLDLGRRDRFEAGSWQDQVQIIHATHVGACEIPLIGKIELPACILVRPDGHVAWVGDDQRDPGLADAISTWFGTPMQESTREMRPA